VANEVVTLLRNASANGTGTPQPLAARPSQGRVPLTYYIGGTFNGATVTLEASPDGVYWQAIPDAAFTDLTIDNLDIAAAAMRATVSNAGASTSITVLVRI
jgi:hypothetical protein